MTDDALHHLVADERDARVQVHLGQGLFPDREISLGVALDDESQHRLGQGVGIARGGHPLQGPRRVLGLDDPDFGHLGQGDGLRRSAQQGQQEGGQGGLEHGASVHELLSLLSVVRATTFRK